MDIINPYIHGGESVAFDGFGNRSRSFDGVSDYIATANDVDTVLDGAFTIAFWLKLDDGQPSATQQFFGVDETYNIARILVTTGGVVRAVYRSNGGTASVADLATSLTNGQQAWVHYAWVVAPTGQKIYVDGSEATLDGTNDGDMTSGVTMGDFGTLLDFYIGARNFNGTPSQFTAGNYADFRIYDTDLTSTDISDLYNGTNITTNLVGHWLTDDDNVLDATGTNHGTNYGTKYSYDNPSPPVEFGSASRSFNGTSDRVTIPANVFNGATALTVSAWIKLDSLGINQTVIGRIDNNSGFRLMVRDANQIDLIWGDGNTQLISTLDGAVLTSGSWIHVAGTFNNSGNATRYVDGAQTGTIDDLSSYGALSILGDIGIGARVQTTNPLYNLPLDGKIADVRLYDTDLTASQVSDLYAGTDVQTNLIGHWLTDNDDVEDKAGTNDGTNYGSTYSYDNPPMDLIPSRQASRSFNGTSDKINVSDSPSFPTGAQTWSCWVKPSRLTFGYAGQDLMTKWGNQSAGDISIILFLANQSTGRPYFYLTGDGGTPVSVASSSSLSVNTWHHVVGVFTPNTSIKIYVDSVLKGTNSTSIPSSIYDSSADFTLAHRDHTATTQYQGEICDARIYDTDLTASQILDIYNGTTDRTNLIGQWLTNSDDVLDHAGTNDGTNFGSTYSTDSPS